MLANTLVLAALTLLAAAQEPGTSTTATISPSRFEPLSESTFASATASVSASAASSTRPRSSGTNPATTTAPSASAQTTITGIVGSYSSGFAASIVAANACDTTLAMQCTDMSNYNCRQAPNLKLTITQGASIYEFSYSTRTGGAVLSLTQSCALTYESETIKQAICEAVVAVSAGGSRSRTSTVETLTESPVFDVEEIPVTAGAEKLPSAGAQCTGTATQEEGAAATMVRSVYRVVVPVGVLVVGAVVL